MTLQFSLESVGDGAEISLEQSVSPFVSCCCISVIPVFLHWKIDAMKVSFMEVFSVFLQVVRLVGFPRFSLWESRNRRVFSEKMSHP